MAKKRNNERHLNIYGSLLKPVFELSKGLEMKLIDQKSVDAAFKTKTAKNVKVCNFSEREWYFTFEANDPRTGKLQVFAMETQRGEVRLWADPRLLFNFLSKRGVKQGEFLII